jgi:hypothetical protein
MTTHLNDDVRRVQHLVELSPDALGLSLAHHLLTLTLTESVITSSRLFKPEMREDAEYMDRGEDMISGLCLIAGGRSQ